MIRFVIFFLFLPGMYASFAQQAKPVLFREEVFDFGSVKEDGGPVVHEFVFTNASNRSVKILTVQASCGCTTPAWSKEPVAPGKTGFIQASYNPKGRPGYFNKTLTVTTDFEPTPIVLQIKGNVSTAGVGSEADFKVGKGNWKLKTGSFNMGKVYLKDEPTIRDFQFLNTGTKPVKFEKVIGPAYIKAEVIPETVAPGERGHIKVIYYGKLKNQYGFRSDNIEIHTNDADLPIKSFTVYATLEDYFGELRPDDLAKAPRLRLAASSMDFGRVKEDALVVREVSVSNAGQQELQIKSVQGNCSCIATSVSKASLKPGESAMINVTFDAADRKGTQQKAVTIYSNDPRQPVQRFTFTAYVEK